MEKICLNNLFLNLMINMSGIQDLNFTAVEMEKINEYIKQIKANIEKEEMAPVERINLAQEYKESDRGVGFALCWKVN